MVIKQIKNSDEILRADEIILVPYANKDNANTGVNIKNSNGRIDLYLKNCCVACATL